MPTASLAVMAPDVPGDAGAPSPPFVGEGDFSATLVPGGLSGDLGVATMPESPPILCSRISDETTLFSFDDDSALRRAANLFTADSIIA